ncbi:hypothetical protein NEOKW01_1718 [Nematocida sp. AWRm80]|nr:hypothetical protein NEOKW01_1718 [Nematocida sp. AWRm80]
MKKEHAQEQTPVQAYKESTAEDPVAPGHVKKLTEELEKVLDINHFMNTRFNRQNQVMCKEMQKKARGKDNK